MGIKYLEGLDCVCKFAYGHLNGFFICHVIIQTHGFDFLGLIRKKKFPGTRHSSSMSMRI